MNTTCRYCGASVVTTPYVCADMSRLPIVKCSQCMLVQTASTTHVDDATYASDSYFPEDLAAWRTRERHWNEKRVSLLEELIPGVCNIPILDFGSGAGGFLEQADIARFNVTGFDLSKRVVANHRSNGWKCANSLDDVAKDVQIVTLFHVLEHLKAPWTFIRDLVAKFPNLRSIVIEVPNENEALNGLFENEAYRRNHYHSYHLYYFSPSTLRNAIARAGLRIRHETQTQRYSLANTIGWLNLSKGGGQNIWPFLNDPSLHAQYERALVNQGIADSLFFVCEPSVASGAVV